MEGEQQKENGHARGGAMWLAGPAAPTTATVGEPVEATETSDGSYECVTDQ